MGHRKEEFRGRCAAWKAQLDKLEKLRESHEPLIDWYVGASCCSVLRLFRVSRQPFLTCSLLLLASLQAASPPHQLAAGPAALKVISGTLFVHTILF
jgi:hypothetical protein